MKIFCTNKYYRIGLRFIGMVCLAAFLSGSALRSEALFLKKGGIVYGKVIMFDDGKVYYSQGLDAQGNRQIFTLARSEIYRIYFTTGKLEKKYIYKKDGSVFVGYVVAERSDRYLVRKVLDVNDEQEILRSDIEIISIRPVGFGRVGLTVQGGLRLGTVFLQSIDPPIPLTAGAEAGLSMPWSAEQQMRLYGDYYRVIPRNLNTESLPVDYSDHYHFGAGAIYRIPLSAQAFLAPVAGISALIRRSYLRGFSRAVTGTVAYGDAGGQFGYRLNNSADWVLEGLYSIPLGQPGEEDRLHISSGIRFHGRISL